MRPGIDKAVRASYTQKQDYYQPLNITELVFVSFYTQRGNITSSTRLIIVVLCSRPKVSKNSPLQLLRNRMNPQLIKNTHRSIDVSLLRVVLCTSIIRYLICKRREGRGKGKVERGLFFRRFLVQIPSSLPSQAIAIAGIRVAREATIESLSISSLIAH